MKKTNDDYVIGSIEFKKNGGVNVVYESNEVEDSEIFELAYGYVIYCLNRMDWMTEFVDQEENKIKNVSKPKLKLIKNEEKWFF